MQLSRAVLAAAGLLLHLTPTAQASAIPLDAATASGLLRRAEQCPTDSSLEQCGQGFPANFCCATGSKCTSIDNGNGALCCPPGQSCTAITPVAGACDAAAYNATQTPDSPVHLLDIPAKFISCAGSTKCCPPGFQCNNSMCVLQAGGGSSASATATPTTAVSLVSAHSTPTTTSSAASTLTNTGTTASDASSEFPPIAVVVGFFPGMLAGSLLALLIVMCVGRRRKRQAEAAAAAPKQSDSSSSLGPVRAHISDPIYQEDSAGRVDFLYHGQRAPSRTSSTEALSPLQPQPLPYRSPGIRRIRSLFGGATPAQTPRGLGVGVDDYDDMPTTPQHGVNREPSMESIKIFSPPEMRAAGDAANRNTTYSDVLRAAGAPRHHDQMPAGYGASLEPMSQSDSGARRR